MGQKINSKGFRLCFDQNYYTANWFAGPKHYSLKVKTSNQIRFYINQSLADNLVTKIYFKTGYNKKCVLPFISIEIFSDSKLPLVFIANFMAFLKNEYHEFIEIKLIEKIPFFIKDTQSIAYQIGLDLIKRKPFRNTIKKNVALIKNNSSTKGLKISLSGRFRGAEMARNEVFRWGSLPLQTIKAKIAYFGYNVITIYGAFGVKVWIYYDF